MICDRVREHFPGAVFLHGEESGREIGRMPDDGLVWMDLDKVMEMAAMGKKRK